jgi:PAS domain S-box-containing protein
MQPAPGGNVVNVPRVGRRQTLHEAAWPDMLANLQAAYAELTKAKYDLERHAAEIDATRDLFQRVVESMTEALFLLDHAGRIVRANPAAAALLGCDEPSLAGRKLFELVGTTAIPTTAWALRMRAPTGRLQDVDMEIQTPGRGVVPVSVSCTMVRDRWGKVTGVLVVARDITDRKRAEEAINRLNADLRRRADELAAVNRELEAFSYSVSHDLRAPLRALDGFSRILIERYAPNLPESAQRYLGRVRDNAQQMGLLVDDLLAFSRLGRQAINRQRVAPDVVAREALDELGVELEGGRQVFTIAPLPECWADRALLKRIFANLLGNAIKYSRTREVARIEVGVQLGGDEPAYYVRDNGVGFDMTYAHKLFGVFQRLHRAEDYEGTGVGLAIVQRIVQRHGGRVWAEAVVDRGATFYFTLGALDAAGVGIANG